MKQVNIRGIIVPDDDLWVYEWFAMDATAPKQVRRAIQEAEGDTLEVLINSNGGDIMPGNEIYTMLREYSGQVKIKIQSRAASAAAIIAMAGESEMSPVAQLMIHNVQSCASGDNRDMEHAAKILKTANQALAAAFVAKTGKSEAEILQLMDDETWFTAEQAVKEGFVDRIMFNQAQPAAAPIRLAASAGFGLLPQEVLDYAREHFPSKNASAKAQAQYNYMLLGGRIK